jgi:CRISPR-associated protein Csy1
MQSPDPKRSAAIRGALQEHVTRRLSIVLSKITGTDSAAENERKRQHEFYQLQPLLDSGAECVGQIQMATHIVKGIHPDPKVKAATNLNVDCAALPALPLVGSHVLGADRQVDATGNGAFNKKAYEIFLLLAARFQGTPILELLQAGDADAVEALGDSPGKAAGIAGELAELDAARCAQPSSHTLAKQLYWPVGDDPHDDAGYHLLAPLYPTSLVHQVYQVLQDRFSEEAKAARDARRAEAWHERPVHEYPELAIQKLGGTKPQNISQLNSERRGDNVLLASLPPMWRSAEVKPVWGTTSLFNVFRWRPEVRRLTGHLRRFLENDPARNLETRTRRDEWVDDLLDELMQFTAEQRTLLPGWTADPRCELSPPHRAWLDPNGVETVPPDLIDALASDFANWLSHQMRNPLPMGDAEYLHWRQLAQELFKASEREDTP